jgi:hypothetical protein
VIQICNHYGSLANQTFLRYDFGVVHCVIFVKKRMQLPSLGDFYGDILAWDAFIAGKSLPQQAHSLLCARLQAKEPDIEKRLLYIAEKRGLSVGDLKKGIVDGTIQNGEQELD